MYYKTNYKSPIGNMTMVSDGQSLNALWIEGQKYYGASVGGHLKEDSSLNVFVLTKNWLDRYFDFQKPELSELPLAPIGSDFRKEVWNILCEIPYGQIVTYGEIAQKIAKKRGITQMSARAVGGAIGHNPVSIIIPCHRVIGSNGKLTGYAAGIEAKIKLLKHENVDFDKLKL